MNAKNDAHSHRPHSEANKSAPVAKATAAEQMSAADVRQLKLQCIDLAARTISPSNDAALAMRMAADYYAFVTEPAKA